MRKFMITVKLSSQKCVCRYISYLGKFLVELSVRCFIVLSIGRSVRLHPGNQVTSRSSMSVESRHFRDSLLHEHKYECSVFVSSMLTVIELTPHTGLHSFSGGEQYTGTSSKLVANKFFTLPSFMMRTTFRPFRLTLVGFTPMYILPTSIVSRLFLLFFFVVSRLVSGSIFSEWKPGVVVVVFPLCDVAVVTGDVTKRRHAYITSRPFDSHSATEARQICRWCTVVIHTEY